MNKKSQRNLILGCLVIVFLIGLWLFLTASRPPLSVASPTPPSNVPALPTPSIATTPVVTNSTPASAPTAEQMRAAHEAEVNREKGMWTLLFATPITFYGKVIDEKKNPVAGAYAKIETDDFSMGPGKKYERITDLDGLFSISGVHGLGLTIAVSKDGYYIIPESYGNFGYAPGTGQSPPHTDPNDPAIFVLRKRGITEPLIVQNKSIPLDKIGTPIPMDLRTGRAYGLPNPDIQVQAWTQDQNIVPGSAKPYDWKCIITVPGGGIQPRTGDEFNFTAPTDGYQPSDEITMAASDPHWMSNQSREYFLKLANGTYARISFVMGAGGNNGCDITSYLNPTAGHTNLEYDPNQSVSK
jgi:hypothetical protein